MKGCVVLFLACFFAAVQADQVLLQQLQSLWEPFKLQHQKTYDHPSVEQVRRNIFLENSVHVAKHNERYEAGLETFQLEMNQYGDMLPHEFAKNRKGLFRSSGVRSNRMNATVFQMSGLAALPSEVDWRTKGAVSRVKNQGECGSCYAFSSIGSLEGVLYRKTGKLVELSEQNVVDCSQHEKYGNAGCDGGFMDTTFQFIIDQKGISIDKDYPYQGTANKCRYVKRPSDVKICKYGVTKPGREDDLMNAVATVGPIAIAIDASQRSLMFYKSGVYSEAKCRKETDHAVVLVGYGTNSREGDYWLIKNSWGTGWGEKGYFRVARNKRNMCGIASEPSYPIL